MELLTAACPTNIRGEWIAPQLTHEQTLENLEAFGDYLAEQHEKLRERKAQRS